MPAGEINGAHYDAWLEKPYQIRACQIPECEVCGTKSEDDLIDGLCGECEAEQETETKEQEAI